MNADDIDLMCEGLSSFTKENILGNLAKDFVEAILSVNEDLRQIVLRNCRKNGNAEDFLEATGRNLITPSPSLIFNSFRLCDLSNVKVVLLGQDPYIKAGEATGLSFGVSKGTKIPPSLKNIYKCLLHNGLIKDMPTHGDLSNWARHGVLLLNTALTTRIGQSNAHSIAWTKYTDGLIMMLSSLESSLRALVFILFGTFAQGKASLIDKNRHIIFQWGHPSPLNRANQSENPKNFKYCNAFTNTNEYLTSIGENPIDWNP